MSVLGRVVLNITVVIAFSGLAAERLRAADPPTAEQVASFGTSMVSLETGLGLLKLERVQKELKLTDPQHVSIDSLQEVVRERSKTIPPLPGPQDVLPLSQLKAKKDAFDRRKNEIEIETRQTLGTILNPQQLARLAELTIQVQRTSVLLRKEIADQLALSDEQRKRLRDLSMSAIRDAPRGKDAGSIETRRSLRESTEKKMSDVLTQEQQAKFDGIRGKEFEFTDDERRTARGLPARTPANAPADQDPKRENVAPTTDSGSVPKS